jgi:hypothetical protein
MNNWLKLIALIVAVALPASMLPAQQPAPAPEPAPMPPPQPANDAADDRADEAEEPDQVNEEGNAAKLQRARELQLRLQELADKQRLEAVAAARAGADWVAAGGDGNVFRFNVGGEVKTEKAAWLGVSTSRVPPALRQHLKLKNKGVGLVVESVEPESPADQAGLEQFDILEKLDDQWIVNSEQFSVIVRMHKPGEEVTLSLIREGQPTTVKAKLAEKELPVLGAANFGLFDGGQGVRAFQVAPGAQGGFQVFHDARAMEELARAEVAGAGFGRSRNRQVYTDNEHTFRITTKSGKRNMEVSDANGVIVFSGPIETREQLEAIPDDVAAKLEKFDELKDLAAQRRGEPATQPNEK